MTRALGYCVAVAVLLVPSAVTAQDRNVRISVVFSSSRMARDTAAIAAAAAGVNRLSELALSRILSAPSDQPRTRKAVAARLAHLYFVSLPTAALAHTLTHEFGHVEHVRRAGARSDIRITRWPWPVPVVFASASTIAPASLGITAGGSEAAFVHESLEAESLFEDETAHYFNWIAFVYAKLDTILYVQHDLHNPTFVETLADPLRDPSRFVIEFELARNYEHARPGSERFSAALDARASALRRQSLYALADLTLVSAVVRILQYAHSGQRFSAPMSFRAGQVGVVPGWHFLLTPIGHEQRGSVRLLLPNRQQVLFYGRRITSPVGDDLSGVGVSWSRPVGVETKLSIQADIWDHGRQAIGFRIDAGLRRVWTADRFDVSASVGYKSDGYLEGFRLEKGLLLGLVGAVKF